MWVDNSNRGSGGATKLGTASIGGQNWTLYQYGGGGEIIWSLGTQGSFAQQPSGTVHMLALLRNLQSRGKVSAGATIGQIDAGWEICSTGGSPETFRVSGYALTAVARRIDCADFRLRNEERSRLRGSQGSWSRPMRKVEGGSEGVQALESRLACVVVVRIAGLGDGAVDRGAQGVEHARRLAE